MMKESRVDFFSSLTDDAKRALSKDDFTVSEILEIIDETPLTDIDKEIAILRYTKCMTFEDIAVRVCLDKQTIQKRIPKISIRLKLTCTKLFS